MVENNAQPPGEPVVSPEPGAGDGFIIGVVEGNGAVALLVHEQVVGPASLIHGR